VKTRPPACYGPWPPRRSIPYAQVAGWHARGPCAKEKDPPWPQPEPPRAESACDLIAFYRDFPYATCSFRTALALATLHHDYAIRTREVS
jgi:hypothetical protein